MACQINIFNMSIDNCNKDGKININQEINKDNILTNKVINTNSPPVNAKSYKVCYDNIKVKETTY